MTKSIFNGHGYFLNDDTASGGLKTEDDLVSCKHCQKPLKKVEWKLRGGMCNVCTSPLCYTCYEKAQKFGCTPYVEQLERAVNEDYKRRQNAKILGI